MEFLEFVSREIEKSGYSISKSGYSISRDTNSKSNQTPSASREVMCFYHFLGGLMRFVMYIATYIHDIHRQFHSLNQTAPTPVPRGPKPQHTRGSLFFVLARARGGGRGLVQQHSRATSQVERACVSKYVAKSESQQTLNIQRTDNREEDSGRFLRIKTDITHAGHGTRTRHGPHASRAWVRGWETKSVTHLHGFRWLSWFFVETGWRLRWVFDVLKG